MPRLRRFLAHAFVLGIGATQSGCCCPGENPNIEVDFDRSSPEIAALIDRCEANRADCEPLCRAALEAEFGKNEVAFWEVTKCDVTMPLFDRTHVYVEYYDGSSCGRAPDGLLAADCADWFARAAYLEAASVIAFVHLAADLVRHGAPRALCEAAIAAAHDEVRHARVMRSLCRGPVPVVCVAPYRPASLRELAMLNAVEGCARETIGAFDPRLHTLFPDIARDEIEHAKLAWAIHAWVMQRLDPTDRVAVLAAHASAFEHVLELVYDPDVASSSSSCANVSCVASAAPVPAASSASFDG